MGLVNRHGENRSDFVVLDASRVGDGPVASVKLPIRLKNALHSNWAPASDFRGAVAEVGDGSFT